jgi:hypothetical protein
MMQYMKLITHREPLLDPSSKDPARDNARQGLEQSWDVGNPVLSAVSSGGIKFASRAKEKGAHW